MSRYEFLVFVDGGLLYSWLLSVYRESKVHIARNKFRSSPCLGRVAIAADGAKNGSYSDRSDLCLRRDICTS